jgi:hypothetical protein
MFIILILKIRICLPGDVRDWQSRLCCVAQTSHVARGLLRPSYLVNLIVINRQWCYSGHNDIKTDDWSVTGEHFSQERSNNNTALCPLKQRTYNIDIYHRVVIYCLSDKTADTQSFVLLHILL